MFERFTDRARRAVVLAQSEAQDSGSPNIGTEHLLAGLALEGEGLAGLALKELGASPERLRSAIAEVASLEATRTAGTLTDKAALATIGIDLDDIVSAVEAAFGPGALRIQPLHIPFSDHAKEALEQSLVRAIELGLSYIGTEHVLLGLCGVSESGAAACLAAVDLDGSGVRQATLALMEQNNVEGVVDHARRLDEFAASRRQIRSVIDGLPEGQQAAVREIDKALSSTIQAAHEKLLADSKPLEMGVFRRTYAREIEPILGALENRLRVAGAEVPTTQLPYDEYGALVARWNVIQTMLAEGVAADDDGVKDASSILKAAVEEKAHLLASEWRAAVPDPKVLRRRHLLELEEALAIAKSALEEAGVDVALMESA